MAWVVAHEKGVAEKIKKVNIGLYSNEFQYYLDDGFKGYLNSGKMRNWHDNYLKNYRDALSHRIPLYVPPKKVTPEQVEQIKTLSKEITGAQICQNYDEMLKLQEQIDNIGDPSPFFTHSFSESGQKIMLLHVQVITDFGTVEDFIANFCAMFEQ